MPRPPKREVRKIFFSYARDDGKWLVKRLIAAVQALADDLKIPIEPWWDNGERDGMENIAPGEPFLQVIEDAIDDSDFMIFLFSPRAVRERGVCLHELKYALDQSIEVLPVIADSRYENIVTPDRPDHDKLDAIRDARTIDWEDFSACWDPGPDGQGSTIPPAEDSALAENAFRTAWGKLKPQIAHGLQGKPFTRRERKVVEDAEACEAAFLRNQAERLKARPAVWAEIERRSAGGVGLIVHGVAGIGKTSLMQWIQTEHDSRIAACWRCERDEPASWEAWRFVDAVAVQLANSFPDYYDATKTDDKLKKLVLRDDAAQDAPAEVFHRLIILPLLAIAPPPQPMYLIVDGLDEVGDEGPGTVPALLHARHRELPRWLRLVATAQTACVEKDPGYENWISLPLDPRDDAHRADLRSYILSSLEEPEFVELLSRAGVDREQAADGLMRTADGNFLVAFWLFKTLRSTWRAGSEGAGKSRTVETIDPESFRRMISDPPRIDDYVIKRLRAAFGKSDDAAWREASRLLAVLTAARRPLSDEELEAFAKIEKGALAPLKRKLAAILKTAAGPDPTKPRTDFFHNGVRKWLRQASDYQIHDSVGDEAIARTLADTFKPGQSLAIPYLREFGLQHLLEVGRVDVAIGVLACFVDEEAKGGKEDAGLGLSQLIKNVFHKLGEVRETKPEIVARIDVPSLAAIMQRGCGEIPALYGPARFLFDLHLDKWPGLRGGLIDSDDLLVRYMLGRAAADSYLATRDDVRRAKLWEAIVGCFENGEPAPADAVVGQAPGKIDDDAKMAAYNLRQWARYAWRFLMPQPEVEDEPVRNHLQAGMAILSASEDYNDHMILWECLLEGSLSEQLLPEDLPVQGIDPRFWRARWPYLRYDLLEYEAQCRSYGDTARDRILAARGGSEEEAARLDAEVAVVEARLAEAESAIKKLSERYARNTPLGAPLRSWNRPAILNRQLGHATESLRTLPIDEVADYLSPFVLHPCWDVVEEAASSAAFLAEFRSDIPKLIARWAKSPHWQARYAAVDTGFNARTAIVGDDSIAVVQALTQDVELRRELARRRTGEQVFDILIDLLHDDPVTRVQFIVAEDLFYLFDDYEKMYLGSGALKQHELETHEYRLKLARREKYLRYWLREAADCTLLDEVFQFVNDLSAGASRKCKSPGLRAGWPLLRRWLDGPISPYLAVQDEWWTLDREDWLKLMAAVPEA